MGVRGRRLLKILGWLVAILLIVVGAAAAALWFGGAPAVVWLIEHPVSSAIGRQIRIAGPLVIRWGAPTQIIVNDIHVANASWGSQPEMFSARRLEIAIYARSLIFGPTRIPSIAFDGEQLLLETSDRGDANWNFSERQKLDGWIVEAIGPDRIVLVRTDVRHEIVVKDRPGKQVAAARQKK